MVITQFLSSLRRRLAHHPIFSECKLRAALGDLQVQQTPILAPKGGASHTAPDSSRTSLESVLSVYPSMMMAVFRAGASPQLEKVAESQKPGVANIQGTSVTDSLRVQDVPSTFPPLTLGGRRASK